MPRVTDVVLGGVSHLGRFLTQAMVLDLLLKPVKHPAICPIFLPQRKLVPHLWHFFRSPWAPPPNGLASDHHVR